MKKIYQKSFISLLIAALVFFTSGMPVLATQKDDIAAATKKAGDYILSQTNSDHWATKEAVDWPLMSLSSVDRLKDMNSDTLTAALQKSSGSTVSDLSKKILSLTAAGKNPKDYISGRDLVQELRSQYHTDSHQFGDAAYVNDDFWAIMALSSAGVSSDDVMIKGSKEFILSAQRSLGGWGYTSDRNTSVDTDDTAAAVMALLSAGMDSGSGQIQGAVSFIHSNQNSDGGFTSVASEDSQNVSNVDTTAWVLSAIYKLDRGMDGWKQSGGTPVDYMLSMQNKDGSFLWKKGSSQKANTSFALIALSGHFYPVKILVDDDTDNTKVSVNYRIEGSSQEVCKGSVDAKNPMEIITLAQSVCGYEYELTDNGAYLRRINDDTAVGSSGWIYLVNWVAGDVGALDYTLKNSDDVLWYYGVASDFPLRIHVNATEVMPDDEVEVIVEGFDGKSWNPVSDASVFFNTDTSLKTDTQGKVSYTISKGGDYTLYAQKKGYVRSQIEMVHAGSYSNAVDLKVTVDIPEPEPEPEISFYVTGGPVDFGTLQPGNGSEAKTLTIHNTGTVNIDVGSMVSGNNVFVDHVRINGSDWGDYMMRLGISNNQNIKINMALPADFSDAGEKNGQLIFWATAVK